MVFIALFNGVVLANLDILRYHASLVATFALAFLISTALGCWLLRKAEDAPWARLAGRVLIAWPWALLVWDAVGPRLDRPGVPFGALAAADVLAGAVVLAVAAILPFPQLQRVAGAAAAAILLHGVVLHAWTIRSLPPGAAGARPVTRDLDPAAARPPQGNVYHLLLDNYLSETFPYLTGTRAAQEYEGFTFFSRYNTNFPRTNSAGFAMMRGRPPRRGESIREWTARAPHEGFWRDLAAHGVGLWMYPLADTWCPPAAEACVRPADVGREAQAIALRRATVDLWFLRLLPASVRSMLNGGPIRSATLGLEESAGFSVTALLGGIPEGDAGAWAKATRGVSPHPLQFFNLRQFDRMLEDESQRPTHGQYVFYHGLIPHPPYILDAECRVREVVESENPGPQSRALAVDGDPEYWPFAECANAMIRRLTDTLAGLGRLNDALIVVHADHGDLRFVLGPRHTGKPVTFALDAIARTYQPSDATYEDLDVWWSDLHNGDSARWRSIAVEVASSGLLLVRFPGRRAFGEDSRPVQMMDLPPTILAHFNVDRSRFPGIPIPLLPADDPRENVFFAHAREIVGKISKYRLEQHGWRLVEDIPINP